MKVNQIKTTDCHFQKIPHLHIDGSNCQQKNKGVKIWKKLFDIFTLHRTRQKWNWHKQYELFSVSNWALIFIAYHAS